MPAYKEKFINDINENDTKVAVSGLVINKDNGLIFLDDGTGVIAVNIESEIPTNTFVRVFGYIVRQDGAKQLQGQIIQDLTQVNKKLYVRAKQLLNQKQ